jgi:hypothetical protein
MKMSLKERLSRIVEFECQYEMDARIIDSMRVALGEPVPVFTEEEQNRRAENHREWLEAMALCPQDEGLLAVYCEEPLPGGVE